MKCDDCIHKSVCYRTDIVLPSYADKCGDFESKSEKNAVNEVLDKIRAEIMKLQTYKMFGGEDTVYVEHEDVLQIIDKYKAESEE